MRSVICLYLYVAVMLSGTSFLTGYIEKVENLPTDYPDTRIQP
jgi:hypothetical protein